MLDALLRGLKGVWQREGTLGEVMAWPSRDLWVAAGLRAHGFLPDTHLAYRPPGPLPVAARPAGAGRHSRRARRDDEEVLVALHLEELRFHLPTSPFVRMVPALETGFRIQLARAWAGASIEEDAPLVLVVERDGTVVGMAETYLSTVREDPAERVPPGRYAYLNSVSVGAAWRGQGIGRTLAQAVLNTFADLGVGASFPYHSVANPLSSRFWPRLGWQPLWTIYQRRHAAGAYRS